MGKVKNGNEQQIGLGSQQLEIMWKTEEYLQDLYNMNKEYRVEVNTCGSDDAKRGDYFQD